MKRADLCIVIDITALGKIRFHVLENETARSRRTYAYRRGASFLGYVLAYMRRARLTWERVGRIALIEGRGSFSATRAAAAVLHILSWQKKIPVAGFDAKAYADDTELVRAILEYQWPRAAASVHIIYQGEPHITAPRRGRNFAYAASYGAAARAAREVL